MLSQYSSVMKCTDESLTVSGDLEINPSDSIWIELIKCSTLNGDLCQSDEAIDSYLQNVQVVMLTNKRVIDRPNFELSSTSDPVV